MPCTRGQPKIHSLVSINSTLHQPVKSYIKHNTLNYVLESILLLCEPFGMLETLFSLGGSAPCSSARALQIWNLCVQVILILTNHPLQDLRVQREMIVSITILIPRQKVGNKLDSITRMALYLQYKFNYIQDSYQNSSSFSELDRAQDKNCTILA